MKKQPGAKKGADAPVVHPKPGAEAEHKDADANAAPEHGHVAMVDTAVVPPKSAEEIAAEAAKLKAAQEAEAEAEAERVAKAKADAEAAEGHEDINLDLLSAEDRARINLVPSLQAKLAELDENAKVLAAILKGVENLDFSKVQRVGDKGDQRVNLQGFLEVVKGIYAKLQIGLIAKDTNINIAEVASKTYEAEEAFKRLRKEVLDRVAALEAVKNVAAVEKPADEAGHAEPVHGEAEAKPAVNEADLLGRLEAVRKDLEAKIKTQSERIGRRVPTDILNIEGLELGEDEHISLKEMLDNISALQLAVRALQNKEGAEAPKEKVATEINLVELKESVDAHEEFIQQHEDKIAGLQNSKADKETVNKTLAELQAYLEGLIKSSGKGSAESTDAEDLSGLHALSERVAALEATAARKENVNQALNELQTEIEQLDARVNARPVLEGDVRVVHVRDEAPSEESKAADERFARVVEERLARLEATTALQSDLEALNQAVAALKGAPVKADAKEAAKEATVVIDPKLSALEAKLEAEVKAIGTSVAGLRDELARLKGLVNPDELGKLFARVNELSGSVYDESKGLFAYLRNHHSRLLNLEKAQPRITHADFLAESDRQLTDVFFAREDNASKKEAAAYKVAVREELGLASEKKEEKEKEKKARDLVSHLYHANVLKDLSDDRASYRLYKTLKNLDPNLFGFGASDLSKCDGKSLRDLEIKTFDSGTWKDAPVANSFIRSRMVEEKAKDGEKSPDRPKLVPKSAVESPFNMNRHSDATRFAIIREVLKQLFLTGGHIDPSTVAVLKRVENSLGINAAHIYALTGNVEALQSLIEFDEEYLNSEDKFGNNVLHYAAAHFNAMELDGENYTRFAKYTAFDYLVAKGADQSQRNSKGLLPIEVALSVGNTAYIKCFMMTNKAATVNGNDKVHGADDKYLLDRAVELGNVDAVATVRRALPSGAVNLRNAAGSTAMHLAAEKGNVKVLDALIAGHTNKASVQSRDSNGNRPVDVAVSHNNVDAIRWFAMHGQYPKDDAENQVAKVISSTVRVAQQRDFGADEKRMAQDAEWTKNEYVMLSAENKEVKEKISSTHQKIIQAFRFYIKSGLTLTNRYDCRIDRVSRPNHLDIYEHLKSSVLNVHKVIKEKAGKIKDGKNPDAYYAFVPENYDELKGDDRNAARDNAKFKADLMYLRELMIAYHLYARKIEAKKGESKTHTEGVFTFILGDLIVALYNHIQDAQELPRELDPVKLLLTCHNSSIAQIAALPLFADLPARDEFVPLDNIKAEQGRVEDKFEWMVDTTAKTAEPKKSRRAKKAEEEESSAKSGEEASSKKKVSKKKAAKEGGEADEAEAEAEAKDSKEEAKPKKGAPKADPKKAKPDPKKKAPKEEAEEEVESEEEAKPTKKGAAPKPDPKKKAAKAEAEEEVESEEEAKPTKKGAAPKPDPKKKAAKAEAEEEVESEEEAKPTKKGAAPKPDPKKKAPKEEAEAEDKAKSTKKKTVLKADAEEDTSSTAEEEAKASAKKEAAKPSKKKTVLKDEDEDKATAKDKAAANKSSGSKRFNV